MGPAAAEARGLARRVEAGDRHPGSVQGAAVEVGLDAAERLARDDPESYGDERAVAGVEDRVGGDRAEQPVSAEASTVLDADGLGVFRVRVHDLAVTRLELPADRVLVEKVVAGEGVHAAHEFGQGVGDDEVGSLPLEVLDGAGSGTPEPRAQQQSQVAVGDVGVLLRPRQGELLLDDRLIEHEPRVVVLDQIGRRSQDLQGAEGVVPGQPREGQPATARIEPHRRRTGQDPDAMTRPHGFQFCSPSV